MSARKASRKTSKKRQTILWITDPWNTLDHFRDTTLRLAQEALEMGISQYWCDVKSIRIQNQKILLNARAILSSESDRSQEGWEFGEDQVCSLNDFTSIHYRTDPPVDLSYLHPLQIMAVEAKRSQSFEVINPIEILLEDNEKLEASAIPGLMPPSVASSQWEVLKAFGKSEGRTVLKPLHDAQSHGIELLSWKTSDDEAHCLEKVRIATQSFHVPILLQRYLPGISEGETRLWFVDGKLLSLAKKLPLKGDFRVDIDRGSELAPVQLTSKEKSAAGKIAKHLGQRKIRLAAVDLIEGFATDFNFTSPGLITQMESITGENLARKILKALEK